MIAGLFIVILMACAWVLTFVAPSHWQLKSTAKKTAAVKAKKDEVDTTLSVPSRAILREFDATPVENQPVDRYELEASLRALDFKYDIEKVHHHFDADRRYGYVNFSCCDCEGGSAKHRWKIDENKPCKMPEYQDIYDEFIAIKYAIKAREEALEKARYREELSGKKTDLDRVASITERLRNEASILKEVAGELER